MSRSGENGLRAAWGAIPIAAACVAVLVHVAANPKTVAAAAVELSPGVIVDPARPAAFLMNPQGGITAIHATSGESIWSTDQAAKPLLLHGDILFAQAEPAGEAGRLHLVGLRAEDGTRSGFAVALELPQGVSASIDRGPRTSFQAELRAVEDDLIVSWSFATSPARRGDKPQLQRSVWRVGLASGEVDAVAPGDALPEPPPPPQQVTTAAESGGLLRAPRLVADLFAAPARAQSDTGDRVVLKRWRSDSGQPLPDVTLFPSGALKVRHASADGRHLLCSRLDPASNSGKRYEWSIFSLETGARVARIHSPWAGASFVLHGASVLHVSPANRGRVGGRRVEEPPMLRSIDVESQAESWSRPVRSTKQRGK